MYSYVVSKINIKLAEIEQNLNLDPKSIVEKLIYLPSPLKILRQEILDKNSGLIFSIGEPIILFFRFLKEPLETTLKTEILINFQKNPGLMISSPRGIGILKRGNPRNYIDSFIGPILAKTLFGGAKYYQPISYSTEDMKPQNWGEDLRKIKVDIPKVGTMTLVGPNLELIIKTNIDLRNYFMKGRLISFKTYSNRINRVIEVNYNGVIKTSENNIKILSDYLAQIGQ